ncbi:GspH/FimT family pseudopilin [Lysobacter koreensis]
MTLVELLTAVAIVAVILGIGLPALGSIRQSTQTASAYHLLTGSLMAARSSAVTRRHPVSICPSLDGLRCRNDGVWEDGWIVFLDGKRTGQPTDTSAILKRLDPLGADLVARSTAGRQHVRYQPDGRASGSNVSLRICSRAKGQLLASVIVNNAGRARTERSGNTPLPCPYAI